MTVRPGADHALLRRFVRIVRRLLLWGIAAYLLVFTAIFTFALSLPSTPALPQGATIIVLSSGQRPDGRPGVFSLMRTEAAVHAWRAAGGAAHDALLIATGGRLRGPRRPSVAEGMAAHAHALGLPDTAIAIEPRAGSTLANAAFSRPMVPEIAPAVAVVTERFHLPRAWVLFRLSNHRRAIPWPASDRAGLLSLRGLSRVHSETAKLVGNLAELALARAGVSLR